MEPVESRLEHLDQTKKCYRHHTAQLQIEIDEWYDQVHQQHLLHKNRDERGMYVLMNKNMHHQRMSYVNDLMHNALMLQKEDDRVLPIRDYFHLLSFYRLKFENIDERSYLISNRVHPDSV